MIDFAVERPLTLQQLATLVPFSYKTLHKWHKYGYRGIKLESRPFPGKVVSSLEATQRFSDRIATLNQPPAAPRVCCLSDVDRRVQEQYGI